MALGAACGGDDAFRCEDDDACVVGGVAGLCEPNGVCSFPDEECASGRRYGQQAPAELAGVCVEDAGGSSSGLGPSTSSSSSGGESSSTGDGSSSSSSSTGDGSSSSTGDVAGPSPNIVFVSSASVMPGEVVVSEADALCNALAADAGLPGEYVAWLSTDEADARDRLDGARGWVRPDGLPFADRPADIAEGRLFYPPALDELGTEVRNRLALTGTVGSGVAGSTCAGWTVFDAGNVNVGVPGATFPGWTGDGVVSCDDNQGHGIYCFGIDVVVPVTFEPVEGRRAFVSNASTIPQIGLAGFDEICATEAGAAGLDGTFRALVASSRGPALSRFDTGAESWVNMFGVPIAANAAALAVQAHLDAPFNVTATGQPVGNSYWTGAEQVTDPADATCSDWMGSSGAALRGLPDHATDWFGFSSTGCNNEARVACFEE